MAVTAQAAGGIFVVGALSRDECARGRGRDEVLLFSTHGVQTTRHAVHMALIDRRAGWGLIGLPVSAAANKSGVSRQPRPSRVVYVNVSAGAGRPPRAKG